MLVYLTKRIRYEPARKQQTKGNQKSKKRQHLQSCKYCRETKFWSGRRDSNSRPSPWQGDALPLSHFRTFLKKLVEGDGFEPSKAQLTDLQSAPFGHSGIPRNYFSNLVVLFDELELFFQPNYLYFGAGGGNYTFASQMPFFGSLFGHLEPLAVQEFAELFLLRSSPCGFDSLRQIFLELAEGIEPPTC